MRCLIGGIYQNTIDATTLRYTQSTADPVSTCQLDLIDAASSITIPKLSEVIILDEKTIPNPTLNLLQNPTFAPYGTDWTVQSYTGVALTQVNQSTATLTLYLANATSAVYNSPFADQLYSFSGTPTVTSVTNVIGNNVTGWGELTAQHVGSWAAASSLPPSPTGHGWLFDLGTFLQGETLLSGAYTPTFRFNAQQGGAAAGTLVGDFVCRLWKWNSISTAFTPIVSCSLTGQTITSTLAALTFQQGYGSTVAFDVGDYLYLDLWFNCKTNANGASNQGITLNNISTDTVGHTGDANAQLVTPGAIVPSSVGITTSNTAVGIDPVFEQYTQAGQIIAGQTYMLSGYYQWGVTDSHVGAFVELLWYDANKNYLNSNVNYFGPLPGSTALTRYSVSGTAPAGAVYAAAWFGVNVTNATNTSAVTLSNVQLEPVWFPDMSYPLPFAGPNQPNCNQFGNSGLWYRQYRKFGGLVNHVFYKAYHGNTRTIEVNAVGFAWLLSLVNVNDVFGSTADSSIITSLLSTYFGNLFDTSQVEQGVTISNLFANWDDLRTINDGLGAQSASFWTVDAYWKVLYQPPGWTAMPFELICDDSAPPNMSTSYPAFNFSVEMDYTQPGSNILVIGGTPAGTTLTSPLTNGTFYTSLSVVALQQALPMNLTCSISGTQGITLSADAAVGATTLNIFSFQALTDYAKGSSISPSPLCARVLDPAAIQTVKQNNLYNQGLVTSLLMRKVNDSTLQSIGDCAQRGLAELIQYDSERYIYHLSTNVELISGQSVPVTSNTDGLNATTLLIQQVSAQWKGVDETMTDVWEYTSDLGAVNRAASTIMSHIFRRTNTNSSSPPVVQTSLVALERIGIVDGPPLAYAQLVFAASPFFYVRLGETTGTAVYDSTANTAAGTAVGGVTVDEPGAIYLDPNASMLFDGSTGYITTGLTITSFASSTVSLDGWFKLTTTAFGSAALFADSVSNVDNKGFQVLVKGNAGLLEFDLGGIGSVSLVASWQTGGWYYWTATYDGTTMILTLYQQLQYPTGTSASQAASGSLTAPTHTASIGENPANGSEFFPGFIDEVSATTQVLSAGTRQARFNIGYRGRA